MSKYGPRVFKPKLGVDYKRHPALGGEWTLMGGKPKDPKYYTVTMTSLGFTCDCPGMVYRGKCRHTQEIGKFIAGPLGWLIS